MGKHINAILTSFILEARPLIGGRSTIGGQSEHCNLGFEALFINFHCTFKPDGKEH